MARILAIDDEEIIRELLEKILTSYGHEVALAQDGEDGVNQAMGEVFDLIVTDMKMPRMTGFELIRCLKSNPQTRAVPILVVTSLTTIEEKALAHRCGCDAFEEKPIDPIRLARKVEQLLNAR